jgi:MFS family permease
MMGVVMARNGLPRDFRQLWAALSVSLIGSEITLLALPLFAATTLHASAVQMGVLGAAGQLPFLLLSLPAGIFADRARRRPILITCDIWSAVLLLSIPLTVPLGGPYFPQLCAVAFGVGCFTVFSQVAHYAYVPTLVGRSHLTECNSRLQISYSVAESGGPGLAGILVQTITAPFAVLVDAATFVCSAVLLRTIETPEAPPNDGAPKTPLLRSLTDGMKFLLSDRLLRPILVSGLFVGVFDNGTLALYVLYATRSLDLNAATIGIIFVAGGLGAIPGAMLARWAGDRFGVGLSIVLGLFLTAQAGLAVPLASGPSAVVFATLALAKAFGALSFTVANIHQWSLRQTVTPDALAGRVTAGQRFVVYGGGSLGALFGGFLGNAIGVRAALVVCALGGIAAPLFILFSPVRQLREQPTDLAEPEVQAPATS